MVKIHAFLLGSLAAFQMNGMMIQRSTIKPSSSYRQSMHEMKEMEYRHHQCDAQLVTVENADAKACALQSTEKFLDKFFDNSLAALGDKFYQQSYLAKDMILPASGDGQVLIYTSLMPTDIVRIIIGLVCDFPDIFNNTDQRKNNQKALALFVKIPLGHALKQLNEISTPHNILHACPPALNFACNGNTALIELLKNARNATKTQDSAISKSDYQKLLGFYQSSQGQEILNTLGLSGQSFHVQLTPKEKLDALKHCSNELLFEYPVVYPLFLLGLITGGFGTAYFWRNNAKNFATLTGKILSPLTMSVYRENINELRKLYESNHNILLYSNPTLRTLQQQ